MRLAKWVCLSVALAGCAGGRAFDPRAFTPPPLHFNAPAPSQSRLSGGASVFLLEDHDVPLVRVYLSFRGGSVYDPPEKAGLARVAGLAWRTGGTASLSPEALDEALENRALELSLSFGRETGWASLTALTGDLAEGLRLLAELLWKPEFHPDRVAWAVSQVADSVRREDDDPQSLAFRELRRALYRGHPRGVVATEETVGRVVRDDVVAFHRRLLSEGAWTIGVVGDFDSQRLRDTLETLFGQLPGNGQGFAPLPAPPEPEPRVILVRKALPQSTLVWARFGPNRTSPEFYPMELADYVLGGGGFQSRLVREIRSNRGLAYSVASFYDAYREFGVLGEVGSTKSRSAAEVLGLMKGLAEQMAQEGLSAEELGRAKEAVANRHVFRYEDPASVVQEQMSLLLDGLPLDLPGLYLPRVLAVTPQQVSEAVRGYYRPGPGVTVVVGDADPADPVWKPYGAVEQSP